MQSAGTNRKTIAMLAGIAAIVVLLYAPTVHNPLLWDDAYLISDNAFVHDLSNVRHLFDRHYFDQGIELSYRPVGTALLFANYAAGNGAPEPFRVTSIILHCLSSMLVFLLVGTVLEFFKPGAPGRLLTAFAAAAIFAAHPLNTEVVNGVTFLEDPLCLIFSASSFILFVRSLRGRGRAVAAMSLVLFAVALLSKETAAALPVAVFAFAAFADEGPAAKRFSRGIMAALPFAVITAAYLVLRFSVMKNPSEHMVYHAGGPYDTFVLTCRAWFEYMRLTFAPMRQCADYFITGAPKLSDPVYAAGAACIIALVTAALLLSRRLPAAALGLFWAIAFLLPVSNIIPIGVTMAERYMYMPLAGLLVAISAIADYASAAAKKSARLVPAAVMLTAALIFSNLTYERNKVWGDEITFWSDAAACSDKSAAPLVNLGVAYFKAGKTAGAGAVLERAIEVAASGNPDKDRYGTLYRAHGNLGMVRAAEGRDEDAKMHLTEALRLNPGYASARFNLAVLYLKSNGHVLDAAREFEAGLTVEPRNIKARVMLAMIYEKTGSPLKAAGQYKLLCGYDPANAAVYAGRAEQLMKRGGDK